MTKKATEINQEKYKLKKKKNPGIEDAAISRTHLNFNFQNLEIKRNKNLKNFIRCKVNFQYLFLGGMASLILGNTLLTEDLFFHEV